jgi:tetratricopeptide (TPR) repeat protein
MRIRIAAVLCGLLAGLALSVASAAQAADCQLVKVAELPVTMAGLRPLVPAKINGKDALFLVDSGAFYSVLNADAVPKYDLKTYAAPMGFYIQGIGGRQEARVSKVSEFTYAGIPLKNIEFLVSGGGYAPGASGIIGQNLLAASDVEFDLANGVIRLFRTKDCSRANLAYWSAGKALSILTIEDQSPLKPHIIAPLQLDGHWIRATFDTGASTSVVSRAAAARMGIRPSSEGVTAGGLSSGFGSKLLETSIASFASVGIGDEEIKNTRLRVAAMELTETDMLVGDDFFLSHRVMVARSQHKLYFTYSGGPVFRLDQQPIVMARGETAPTAGAAPPAAVDGPKTAAEFSRRGDASAARRDYPAAITDFTKAIELEPNDSQHFHDRAMARLSNRQPVLAMADLSQTLKLKPDDLQALAVRGELYLSQKDATTAQADFDAAIKLAPNDSELPLRFARAYVRARLFETAVRQYGAWIDSHPNDPALAAALEGRCRTRALWGKELEPALADCDQALRRGQKISVLLDSRALVLLRLGRFDEAIKQYDAAIRAQPKDPWSLYGRGLAKLKKGEVPEGQADLQAATAIESNIASVTKSFGLAPDEQGGKPGGA